MNPYVKMKKEKFFFLEMIVANAERVNPSLKFEPRIIAFIGPF